MGHLPVKSCSVSFAWRVPDTGTLPGVSRLAPGRGIRWYPRGQHPARGTGQKTESKFRYETNSRFQNRLCRSTFFDASVRLCGNPGTVSGQRKSAGTRRNALSRL